MTDEGKIKCNHCNYKGHKLLLQIHLLMEHGVEFEDEKSNT